MAVPTLHFTATDHLISEATVYDSHGHVVRSFRHVPSDRNVLDRDKEKGRNKPYEELLAWVISLAEHRERHTLVITYSDLTRVYHPGTWPELTVKP